MKTYFSTEQAELLANAIFKINMDGGEITTPERVAETVARMESDYCITFAAQDILWATRNAAESFVESMVQNEHDTESEVRDGIYQGYPIEPLESRVAQWEAMRPSTVRRNEVQALLSTHVVKVLYSAPAESAYHDNTTWFSIRDSDDGLKGVWMTPGQRIALIS